MEPHDVPPPPYSETDIYASSDHHSSSSDPALTRPHTQADDASSSRSNIIYTPPDTPQDSHHAFSGAEDVQTTASAQVYFDARAPADHLRASAPIVHTISVSDDPCPADFPLPAWAASRDVNPQDWRTFINYLIPDYADKANISIIDRKSREGDGPSASAAPRDAPRLDDLKSSSQRRLADTVREWNGGFFGPRGVSIRLLEETSTSEPKARMPSGSVAGVQERDAPQQQPQQQQGGWRSMLSQRLGMTINDRGLRMGPLTIDNDRVAFGSSFEADGRGVRWNGRDIAEQFSSGGGRGRGRVRDARGRGRWWHDGGASHPHPHGGAHMFSTQGRRRSQSVSSDSSSSSSDSASTVSSIGSLPDWDDLRDSQMPVVRSSVEAWLARPEHIVTKAELKRAKAEIKAAKSLSQPAAPADPRQREEIRSLLSRFGDLKKHQRAGLKTARKQAKAQRRAEKRTRKARNRGERKEERRHKREHKRAEREQSRQRRRNGKAPELPSQHPEPPAMVPPFAPGAHPAHPFPAEHQYGPGPSVFGPGRSGGPGFPFSGGWGRGGHHHHQQWPPAPSHPHPTAEGSRAAAQSHAVAAREQAFQARVAAHEQAIQARARAHEMAVHHRAAAHEEAVRARAQAAEHRDRAHSQAEQARASAAAEAARERYAAKYRAAEALEQEMEGKRVALRALQESAEAVAIAEARNGRGDQKRACPSPMERNAEALERELEDLGCRIEELVFEADEEFAKSLENESSTRDEKSKVRWVE